MKLLTLRFAPFETPVQLGHELPCAQRSVAPPQRLTEFERIFERSKLIVHDFTHEIIEFLQVEYDNVVRRQRFSDLQVCEQ